MFEKNVIKQIPKRVSIVIQDLKPNNEASDEVKDWILKYKIICLKTSDTRLFDGLDQAKALKFIEFRSLPSIAKVETIVRKNTFIHSILIHLKNQAT